MSQIDLNNPEDLTLESVAALIASKDDSEHRQLRVTKDGIAYLSDEVGGSNVDGLAFYLETWSAGGDYVGQKASQDEKWVQRVYNCLKKHWPAQSDSPSYIDQY